MDDVAERNGVGEELLADRDVDALHLAVKYVLRLRFRRGLLRVRKPGVIEETDALRDEAVGERAGELEE